jgi:hypothetical protein
VNPDLETYLALLEQRLCLLRLLAQEFVESRKEFVALDLDGMYQRISEQEELCRQIQRLHPAIQSLQKICAAHVDLHRESSTGGSADHAKWAERVAHVMRQLGEAQAEVGRLNQTHAAYLRRSRRTINVLMNFVGSYAMTYARPAAPAESMAVVAAAAEKG